MPAPITLQTSSHTHHRGYAHQQRFFQTNPTDIPVISAINAACFDGPSFEARAVAAILPNEPNHAPGQAGKRIGSRGVIGENDRRSDPSSHRTVEERGLAPARSVWPRTAPIRAGDDLSDVVPRPRSPNEANLKMGKAGHQTGACPPNRLRSALHSGSPERTNHSLGKMEGPADSTSRRNPRRPSHKIASGAVDRAHYFAFPTAMSRWRTSRCDRRSRPWPPPGSW